MAKLRSPVRIRRGRSSLIAMIAQKGGAKLTGIASVARSNSELRRLEQMVRDLTVRVAELEAERRSESVEVIEIREISKEQAKQEILQAFESGEPLDEADLAETLSLDFSLVVEVCKELIEDGVVVLYDDDGG